MLRIPAELWDRIARHCNDTVPEEAVGYLAAVRGSEESVTDVIPVLNVADDAYARYEVDEREQLDVWALLEERHKRPVATYHSHVNADARLSDVDISLARDSRMLHLVVSVVVGLGVADADLFRVEYAVGVPVVVRVSFEVIGRSGGAMFVAPGP